CGKPVCNDCAVTEHGAVFCDLAVHRTLSAQWSILHEGDSDFESDMIRTNLEQDGIPSLSFSVRDHVGTYWLPEASMVKIHVRNEDLDRARQVLRFVLEGEGSRRDGSN
ncbi:MAG: hypothetical protein WD295_03820, partial [Bacteroidota bacterium]